MKFIYVFSKNHALRLQMQGYTLIQADDERQMWVFENRPSEPFFANFSYVLSNTMTF